MFAFLLNIKLTTSDEGNFTNRQKRRFGYGNSISCFSLREKFINGNLLQIRLCGVLAPKRGLKQTATGTRQPQQQGPVSPGNSHTTRFRSSADAVKAFSSTYKFVPRCTTRPLWGCWRSAPLCSWGQSVCWKVLAGLELVRSWLAADLLLQPYPAPTGGKSTGRCISCAAD